MQIDSYKAVTKTAEAQAAFLAEVRESVERDKPADEPLSDFMKRTIQVGVKPFSQVDHLTSLENESDGWDFDETAASVKEELARSAFALRSLDRGYDIPHFVHGFHNVVQELKDRGLDFEKDGSPASAPAKDKVPEPDGNDHSL